jgi:hypothetical protein
VDGWGCFTFDFGGTGQCWFSMKVGPFPSEDVFFTRVDEDLSPELMASFLTQQLAVNHPALSITFDRAAFSVNAVEGAIRSLNLDPAIEEEAQRRREERAAQYGDD